MRAYDEIRAAVVRGDDEAVRAWADRRKNLLSVLFGLTFDMDPCLAWRAVRASGIAARRIAETDPEKVRDHMRRLVWSLNDESGGIGWRAPETMAEILFQCPETCRPFMPILVSLLDMDALDRQRFLPGILWALGRLAPVLPRPEKRRAGQLIRPLMDDPAPRIRGLSLWSLGELGLRETPSRLRRHLRDDTLVEIPGVDAPHAVSIARLAGNLCRRERPTEGAAGNGSG